MLVTFELNGLMTAEYLVIHKGEGGGGGTPHNGLYKERLFKRGNFFSL